MTIEKKYNPRCFFDVEIGEQPGESLNISVLSRLFLEQQSMVYEAPVASELANYRKVPRNRPLKILR